MAKIPKKNADVASLGVRVVTHWVNYPSLTLEFITQADAVTLTTNYYNMILQTNEGMGSERDKVRSMRALDKEINTNLYYLKLLIEMEYGRNDLQSHYADFGIKKENGSYNIPSDRDSRLQALRLTVSSLATAPFSGSTYGLVYWQNILTQYEAEKIALEAEVGKVSGDVFNKNLLKDEVVELLRSFKHLLIANYPKSYIGMLREFGYLDEYA